MSENYENAGRTVVSSEGIKKLENKLKNLTTTRRAEIADQIATARGFGDLSENAEYDEAKNEQSRLEAEIIELENTIRTALVIDGDSISTDQVNIGTIVRTYDEALQEEEEYTIVGARESDPMNNLVSNESPIGAALLGKKQGDIAQVETPDGIIRLRVLNIHK
jgi:transcription elongation factor GreA